MNYFPTEWKAHCKAFMWLKTLKKMTSNSQSFPEDTPYQATHICNKLIRYQTPLFMLCF